VISTDGGALPEVVGDAGIIVPVRDASALEQAIESLLQNPQRREQLAVAGRQRILERFSWQVCAAAMDDYYRKVIADANR
ncbi:MAG: glycosyltransferase, partial [Haliea sp.]